MGRDTNPTGVRMPDALKQALEKASKTTNRSLNAEIISRLQASINADEYALGAQSGDPYAAALTALETIRAGTRVLEKSLLKIGVDEGRVQIGEETEGYQISPVNEEEQQLLQLLRRASPELKQAVFNLLAAIRDE